MNPQPRLGPQPLAPEERRNLAQRIAEEARRSRADVLAVGLYGSLARDEDGPYSDIEILCVLGSSGEEYTREGIVGPAKVEVNFLSQDVLFARAAEVPPEWPLTHGAYVYTRPLYDPQGVFPRLREAVRSPPEEAFRRAMQALIVEELYELMGKVRNARHWGAWEELPFLAVHLAFHGALLVGLANRHVYRSASKMLADSLGLPERPSGYDRLCALVQAGKLDSPQGVGEACEGFWCGVSAWAAARGLPLPPLRL
ncbi:MAG: nucleotidyltransferase [Candidatus Bipolaricaulota bacterium]|nr:nucleotidyltransferase [Candidatus Bipolaricaulota bacterium]